MSTDKPPITGPGDAAEPGYAADSGDDATPSLANR